MLEAVVAAIALGSLAGGKFTRLSGLKLRGAGLIFAALIVQLALPVLARFNLSSAAPHILTGSFVALLAALLLNKMTPAIALMSTGVLLNLIVIAANGGMPVRGTAMPVAAADHIHIRLTEVTRFPWLADVIPWPLPGPFNAVVSPGDLFLSAGVFILLVDGMLYKGRRRMPGKSEKVC